MQLTKRTGRLMATGAMLTACFVGVAVWRSGIAKPSRDGSRKVICYQDSMHPWIKSDQPGKCTVCSMDLTPIYEGTSGFEVGGETIVLSSNSVTVLNVQTEKAKKEPLRRTLRVAGSLEASETSKRVITAGKAGRIEHLAVPYVGFEVAEGQRLANFFIPELLAEARRYAMLARSGARGGQAHEADLSNPLLSTPQNLRLFGLTETQIENLAKTGKAEGFFELLSPQMGTVIERNVSDGQYVSEGSRLFTIVDLSVLWFRFDVYEQDLPWLQVGQVVDFSVPTAPGQVFSGPITFIEPVINEATRAAKVRVDVNNPVVEINGVKQRALRHQLYAEGRVRIETPARLVVSSAAVLFPGEKPFAYVATGGGAYEARELKLGRRGDREWEVLSGLDEGEEVVTTGNVLIDAQAQITRGNSRGEATVTEHASASHDDGNAMAESSAAAPKASGLSPAQQKTLTEFLAAAAGVSRALAADRLDQLKPHATALPALAAAMGKELGAGHAWQPFLDRVQSAAQWAQPKNLEAAREFFLPFSTSVVDLVQQVRSHEESFRSLKVYQCPMAPKPGLWFQLEGPLRNPYFGAEMLTCGKEVAAPPPSLAAPNVLAKPSEPAPPHDAVPTPPAPAPALSPATSPPAAEMPRHKTGSELMATSPQVQPLNSRDHSAFDERMKSALADRFSSRSAPESNAAGRLVPPASSSVKQSGPPAQPASGTKP